ncbi:hypothetical protein NY78_0991 [Desulfovibrio sp. TomC]|nr:hypothetical protein NY78_0991 [Desulfovibrio sp. TomC]
MDKINHLQDIPGSPVVILNPWFPSAGEADRSAGRETIPRFLGL